MQITKTAYSKLNEVDFSNLAFGSVFSDHMLVMDYENGQWQEPTIVPFAKLHLSPSLSAINYGQAVFEGMKAYKSDNDEILLFRPHDNWVRLNVSAERMCMPQIPENLFMEGLNALINLDKAWVPNTEGAALYIRPIYFATDEAIGVRPSDNYKLVIFTCPVMNFFKEPLKVYIETHYARSCEGGPGYAKAAGNYAGALYPTKLVQDKGYNQIIWTDAAEHKYLEESGAMNLMAVVGDNLITPSLTSSKLAGITRDSILKIAKHWNVNIEERQVSIDELVKAHKNNTLKELFGVGTAANIAPIKMFGFDGQQYNMPEQSTEMFSYRAGKYLTDIKTGAEKDLFNWIKKV